MERGKLYVFFGSSGSGKDFMANKFIKFCQNNGINISECRKLLTRSKRETSDSDFHQYGLSVDTVCNSSNFYAELYNEFVGISKEDIEENLSNGKSQIIVTGSIDLLEQLMRSQYNVDLCMIHITSMGFQELDYFSLAIKRKPNMPFEELKAANLRYEQSLKVKEYYQENKGRFDYVYFNTTMKASQSIVSQHEEAFFDKFFEDVISGKKGYGPCWISGDGDRTDLGFGEK